MGFGPVLAYRDAAHLRDALATARQASISVEPIAIAPIAAAPNGALAFKRGLGRVVGHLWGGAATEPAIRLVCDHGNPLLWPSDMRLLSEVERHFLASGSRLLTPEEIERYFYRRAFIYHR